MRWIYYSSMPVSRLIFGTIIFLLSVFGVYAIEGGHFTSILNASAGLLMGGSILGLLIMSYGFQKPVKQALQLMRGEETPAQDLRGALNLVSESAMLIGLLGTVLGLIHVMFNLSDPSKIGAGVAVAFICLVYSTIIAMVASGFSTMVDNLASPQANPFETDDTNANRGSGLQVAGGLIFLLGTVSGAVVFQGMHLSTILFPSAALLVFGATGSIVGTAYGVREPLVQLSSALKGDVKDALDVSKILGALRLSAMAGPLTGLLGTVLGLIHVMENLSDPTKIGGGVALSMISMAYGCLIAIVAYGLSSRVEKVSAQSDTPNSKALKSSALYGMTGFFILLTLFFVVLYAIQVAEIAQCMEKLAQASK